MQFIILPFTHLLTLGRFERKAQYKMVVLEPSGFYWKKEKLIIICVNESFEWFQTIETLNHSFLHGNRSRAFRPQDNEYICFVGYKNWMACFAVIKNRNMILLTRIFLHKVIFFAYLQKLRRSEHNHRLRTEQQFDIRELYDSHQ